MMTLPFKILYATDSAALIQKAQQVIAKAKEMCEKYPDIDIAISKNPFKRPWGLQTDGDVWREA